jgi:hypothetical protein
MAGLITAIDRAKVGHGPSPGRSMEVCRNVLLTSLDGHDAAIIKLGPAPTQINN